MSEITVREFIKNYETGKYDSKDTGTMIAAGWYDWFDTEAEAVAFLAEVKAA
jgi:hypothetical protein